MRFAIIVLAAALLLPATAKACYEAVWSSAREGASELVVAKATVALDLSAKDKKKPMKAKHAKRIKKPKEKVEYMRALTEK